jgi:hypothetical protein
MSSSNGLIIFVYYYGLPERAISENRLTKSLPQW